MHRNKPNGNHKDPNEFPVGFKADQAWTYTYDAQGKRRNYSYDDAAETPNSQHGRERADFQTDPRYKNSSFQYTSAAAAGPSKSYTSHSSYSTSSAYYGNQK